MKSTASQFVHAVLITVSVVLTPLIGLFGPFSNGNLGGQESMELFSLAGYAFAIWSVIYAGLFALGIWQGLPAQRQNPRARRAAPWLSATAVGCLVWIACAGSVTTAPLTVPLIIFMGVTAWIAYVRLGVGDPALPAVERALHIPLQIYVGWLSVATVANTATVLNMLGWGAFGIEPVTWALAMLVIATALAWIVGRLVGHDNVYRAVFVWAFVAVFVAQRANPIVAWSALVAAGVVLLMIVFTLTRQRRNVAVPA